jgi:dienelactone hydrolase
MCLVEIGWAVAAFGNPVLWGGLEPGAYDVGFRVLALVDPTRSYGKRLARPVQVSLWYPVTRNPARSVTSLPFGDYVALYMTPVPQGHKTESRTEAFERYRKEWFPKEPQSSVIRLLETPAFAQRGAPPAKGPFPLVIYAPGYGAIPLTHTPTAEYLASHGYVVALSPSQGDSPAGMTFDVAGQEQQIRDIEFTLGALRNRPTIDSSKIALIGFSFGGGAAVVAAMRNLDIRAVVSLDGTVAFDHTVDILRQATGYDPAKFRSPLLVLKAEGDPEEDLSIVRSLAVSDRVVIRFRGVEHHDFIASPIISSVVTGRVTPSGKRAYPLVVSTILRFLNEHMTTVDPALHAI